MSSCILWGAKYKYWWELSFYCSMPTDLWLGFKKNSLFHTFETNFIFLYSRDRLPSKNPLLFLCQRVGGCSSRSSSLGVLLSLVTYAWGCSPGSLLWCNLQRAGGGEEDELILSSQHGCSAGSILHGSPCSITTPESSCRAGSCLHPVLVPCFNGAAALHALCSRGSRNCYWVVLSAASLLSPCYKAVEKSAFWTMSMHGHGEEQIK